MPAIRPLAALIGGLAFTVISPAAFAGCGGFAAQAPSPCNPGSVYSAAPYQTAPVQVAYTQPYGHLKDIGFKQTPNVNVMRIQSGPALAPLSGAPNAFWGGCSNASGAAVSSAYCGAPVAAQAPRPIYRPTQPVYAAPAPQPVYAAPAPQAPRMAPGHAYVSYDTIVHRVPPVMATPTETVQLQSRRTTSYASPSYSSGSSYGGGWKQVSGPTVVDGMQATQVICKQPEPAPAQMTQSYQVVRPVVEVGYPVPVAVRGNVCDAPRNVRSNRYGR